MQLEARLSTGEDGSPCTICNRSGADRPFWADAMETYLAGTEDWVCCACAARLDENLCRFAYGSEDKPEFKKKLDPREVNHFGHCLLCASDGPYLNVGKDHWKICERHGLRWHLGYNLLSSWTLETEEDWARNQELLARFRDIMRDETLSPYSLELVVAWPWRVRVRRRLAAVSSRLVARLPEDFRAPQAGNEWSTIESSAHDLERLRDVAAERFGQESALFRQIDEALKNGGESEMEDRKRTRLNSRKRCDS